MEFSNEFEPRHLGCYILNLSDAAPTGNIRP